MNTVVVAIRVYAMRSLVIIFFSLLLLRGPSEVRAKKHGVANLPPRGWNSYDSFDWVISEQEFLQNVEILSKRLRSYGYEYVVVDYLWYRRHVDGSYTDAEGFDVIDEWGRVIPDPGRWPSSKGGNGFKEVARKVHDMGLKFGIHVMRGISTQAFNANTPILNSNKGGAFEVSGRVWRAQDIGMKDRVCAWMPHGFMSVNTDLDAGRAFLRSLYQQYAEWGVDFVKLDCVFGADYDINEIITVSEILQKLSRPIVYSISPGTGVTPAMAEEVSSFVNMYRITGDDWDNWPDVKYHFDLSRDIAAAHLVGVQGLNGKSWPDLDMLPLGWLTNPGSSQLPHRRSNLTLDEQRTQMTLWSMAKSPLIFGGDLRKLDENTFNTITNSVLLEINHHSKNNMEMWKRNYDDIVVNGHARPRATVEPLKGTKVSAEVRTWIATGRRGEIYVALFNLSTEKKLISVRTAEFERVLKLRSHRCAGRELWSGKKVSKGGHELSASVGSHGCALFVLHCK